MTLGSRYGQPPAHASGLFRAVRGILGRADVTTGNLEGTFGRGGRPKCGPGAENCFAFQAPPGNAAALPGAGFDVVNLANNHALDYGPPGRRQTVAALRRVGVAWTGAPGQIRVVRRRGIRLAFVGFAPYPWAASVQPRAAARLVRRAARRADVVVAFMHVGAEGAGHQHTPTRPEHAFGEFRGNPRVLAHRLVDAGADLVLGSGPHVLRGVEGYRGRVIAYSLGNFVGYRNFSLAGSTRLSGILTTRVDRRGRFRAASFASIRLVGPGIPVPDPSRAAARLVESLSRADFDGRGLRSASEVRLLGAGQPRRRAASPGGVG
jgi:poly-gamma-glutamate capsule biosynthesis protein CapA/YwtB (metallophosphatase superfamily)